MSPAFLPFLAAILLVYIFMWLSVLAVDEGLDAHEAGLAVVAARVYFIDPIYLPLLIGTPHTLQATLSENRAPQRTWQNLFCCAIRSDIAPRHFAALLPSMHRSRPRTENDAAPRSLASPRGHAASASRYHASLLLGCALARHSAGNSTTNSMPTTYHYYSYPWIRNGFQRVPSVLYRHLLSSFLVRWVL
jgi:hypothetical protein